MALVRASGLEPAFCLREVWGTAARRALTRLQPAIISVMNEDHRKRINDSIRDLEEALQLLDQPPLFTHPARGRLISIESFSLGAKPEVRRPAAIAWAFSMVPPFSEVGGDAGRAESVAVDGLGEPRG